MSRGLGPLAAEVPALDEQVGGDHHVTLGGAQDGGVVTRSDVHLRALVEPARQLRDQAELPHVGERGVRCERVRMGSWRHPTRFQVADAGRHRVPPRLVVR